MSNCEEKKFREHSIGTSHLGQPLQVRLYDSALRPLRLLILCGQHGDERAIRKDLNYFLDNYADGLHRNVAALQLAVIADANPDGFAARTRNNAQGIDLNRDHLELRAPETRAIHEFIRTWRPHLIVDLHNYPARRKHLVDQNLRLGWDVCLEIPTTPAAGCSEDQEPFASLFENLNRVSVDHGFQFGRYGLHGVDGSFRHGTPRLGDARNTLTLRYEVPTLLLEARNPSSHDLSQDRIMVREAVAAALLEICFWAAREGGKLLDFELPSHAGWQVPFSYRRQPSSAGQVPVWNMESGSVGQLPITFDRRKIQPRRHRELPSSYTLHPSQVATLKLLEAQGYKLSKSPQCTCWEIPVNQMGGRLIALLLDENSSARRLLPGASE